MGRNKKTLEEQINDFLDVWDCKQLTSFLRDIIPLFELYDVDDEDDWLERDVGGDAENVRTIRLLRTVYLISKIVSNFSPVFCKINSEFRDLWKKIEKAGMEYKDEGESICETATDVENTQ
jgi:hypothetical protein